MSLYDGPRRAAHTTIKTIHGEPAVWTPSGVPGAEPVTGLILVRTPTKIEKLNGLEYSPFSYFLEWQKEGFIGLFEAIRGGSLESVYVNGERYVSRSADARVTGKGYECMFDLKP